MTNTSGEITPATLKRNDMHVEDTTGRFTQQLCRPSAGSGALE
jgi:hypothetical protein